MYDFITGPLLWVTFLVFFGGLAVRFVLYVKGLDWKLDRVAYREFPGYGAKGALRSIVFWLIPFKAHGWREKPFMTLLFFTFHGGLLITPVFLLAHNVLLSQAWGFSLPALPGPVADVLTIAVLVAALFLILRRIALPEVRILTTFYDYVVLAIAAAPFVTGLAAARHWGNYDAWLIAHILSGEIMLMAIPFTKLSHFLLFFLSRAQIGADYGIKRGGMKSKGLAW